MQNITQREKGWLFTEMEQDVKTLYFTNEYLGAHRVQSENGFYRYSFRLFDEGATNVSVCGDFNDWKELKTVKNDENGVFEGFFDSEIPLEGTRYKYRIRCEKGSVTKSDPCALYYENGGSFASIIYKPDEFEWQDCRFMSDRKMRFSDKRNFCSEPLNIYEIDLGSWRTLDGRNNASGDAYMNYRDIAAKLSEYLSVAKYTHIEIISETSGLFAPSSLFGTPEDFKFFVDTLHRSGIGVIVDIPLETDPIFIPSALFWLREFHVDGLKIDFDKNNENTVEISTFFQKLNDTICSEFPDVMTIFGKSSDFIKVTYPTVSGGLGFTFKQNVGWADDIFDYIETEPYLRHEKYRFLTFSTKYSFSENFILGVSHDRVTNGKKSLIEKISGSYSQKFATVKAFMVYMMSHPGKKLLFMGCEFGQVGEWDPKNQLEWFMADFDFHAKLQKFIFDINELYRKRREFWELDVEKEGFRWISNDRGSDNVIAYERKDRFGKRLLFVINFSISKYENYRIPAGGGNEFYREVLNTDLKIYGGRGYINKGLLTVSDGELVFGLPPLSALIFEPFEPRYEEVVFEVIKS